jgi:hypothetical protein
LPGVGIVCRAALSGFTPGKDGLKRPAAVGRGQESFGNGILEANCLLVC